MIMEAPSPAPNFPKVKMFIYQPRCIAAKSLTERVRDTNPYLKNQIGLRMGHGVREYESTDTHTYFCTTVYRVRLLADNMESFRKPKSHRP